MFHRGWIALIVFIPIIPKVKVLQLSNYPVLLDDFVLLCGVSLGLVKFVAPGRKYNPLFVSGVGIAFGIFFAYKLIGLLVLALIYPLGDIGDRGAAVLLDEGLLVSIRVGILLAVYLLLYSYIRSLSDVYRIIKLLIACMVMVIAVSMVQYFVLDHPVVTATFRNIHALSQIIPGVWGLKNPWIDPSATGHEHLGAFMVLGLAVSGGVIIHNVPVRRSWRRASIACWLMGVFVLMVCSSRGSWIGAICALGVCVLLAVIRSRKTFVLRGIVLLVLGLGVLYFIGFDFNKHIVSRVEKLPAILEGKVEDDSAKHRLHTLKILLEIFVNKPLVGWGAGGAGRIAEGQIQRELVEGGLVGGILFICILGCCAKIALKVNRLAKSDFARGISFGYICGLFGLMGQALFTELFILPKVIIPFWIIGVIVHRLYFIEIQEGMGVSAEIGVEPSLVRKNRS